MSIGAEIKRDSDHRSKLQSANAGVAVCSRRQQPPRQKSGRFQMDHPSSATGISEYYESLMRAGQQATKQFDDALASAMGVGTKPAEGEGKSPYAIAAELQKQYWSQVMGFWKGVFPAPSAPAGQPSARDRRFKDEAWHHSPYYNLLKRSYLMASKQMTDIVDQAQIDDKSKLQLRFYARQFMDAMSPANFPA